MMQACGGHFLDWLVRVGVLCTLLCTKGSAAAAPGLADVYEGEIRAQELLAAQYVSTQQQGVPPIEHPFPAYPNTTFTYSACNADDNPYLLVLVSDQQVPVVVPSEPINHTVEAFAINTWAEITYTDPDYPDCIFHIAEDLIYDVSADTFAVATPFDVRGGQQETPGISSVGASPSGDKDASADSGSDSGTTYNIRFTFAATPLAGQDSQIRPSDGVVRIFGGQLNDTQSSGTAFSAFSDLVARLYFNIATAALGNACNPGYPELIPAASYMLNRLRRLAPGSTVYRGLPLFERLVVDGHDRLCIQETHTLYLAMTLLNETRATSPQDCCHACRASGNGTCNAWTFCGVVSGCMNEHGTVTPRGTCNLFFSANLMYSISLDTQNATMRGENITFVSGRTAAVLPTNVMSVLVPIEGFADSQFSQFQPMAALASSLQQQLSGAEVRQ